MIGLYIIVACSIILEAFPISSSTHSTFLIWLLESTSNVVYDPALLDALNFIAYGPIALVIALFFYRRWIVFIKKMPASVPIVCKLMWYGFIIEIISVLGYYTARTYVTIPTSYGFCVTTIALFSLYFIPKKQNATLSVHNALIIGCAQACSFLPGISRFGFTFAVLRWCGFSEVKAFELSFLIEWPIAVAALGKGLYDLHAMHAMYILHLSMICVMIVASALLYFSFDIILIMVKRNIVWVFGFYTAVLCWLTKG